MKTKEEIEILRADAIAGDAVAQNDLGCAYSSGDGVVKSMKEAFMWFERSAKQGNKYGQYNVGWYYQYGFGVKKNVQSAIEWYEKSALQGFGKAANMLGQIYETGYKIDETERIIKRDNGASIEKNPREAFYWYKMGANNNEGLAKYNLARCYELGIGTPVVLMKALELYATCGKSEQEMQDNWDNIAEYFNPTQSKRIRALTIFNQNLFRILGIWSNSSEKEIRAIKSRMDALLKVGKEIDMQIDHVIPSNILKNLETCEKNKKYAERMLQLGKKNDQDFYNSRIDNSDAETDWWMKVKEKDPSWSMIPTRNSETIDDAIRKLSSDECRIKYALFWFCKITEKDEIGLNLLKEQNSDEAYDLWEDKDSFSSLINQSVLDLVDGNDNCAISKILTVIHNDTFRKEFLTAVTSARIQMSEEDLSQIFWDEIFDLPDAQYSTLDFFHQILNGKADYSVKEAIKESDIEYIQNKCFEKMKKSIDSIILKIDSCQDDDYSRKYDAFLQLVSIAKEDLKWIRRFFNEEYYRYRLLCDDIANRILTFAIHYNNDNKDSWKAPNEALYLASQALNIAINDTLRSRCKKNIDIFANNKKIATTDKILAEIDKKFKEIDLETVKLSQAEKLQSDILMYVECIKTENGKESYMYKNVSDNAVNALLNVIITICNKEKKSMTASSAFSLLKKMEGMEMSSDTKTRLERNLSIISNNIKAATSRTYYGNNPNYVRSSYTDTKERKNTRRIHKIFATIPSVIVFVIMCYYMSWNNNLCYFMNEIPLWGCICVSFMSLVALFIVIMWSMEFQEDPYNTDFDWLNNAFYHLMSFANAIMKAGARDGKTYTWPFAIPFQLLAIVIYILRFPIEWLAKLSAFIK